MIYTHATQLQHNIQFFKLNNLDMYKQDLPTKMCFEHFYIRYWTTLFLCYTVFLIAWLLWRMLNLNYAVYTTLNSYNREQTQCKQKDLYYA